MGGKAALVLVLGFAMVWGYVSNNLSKISGKAVGNVSLYATAVESHSLALTGANVGLAKFYQDTSWRGSATQTFTNGPFRGSFTYSSVNLPSGDFKLRSVSTCQGRHGTLHDTVEVFFDKTDLQSFSLFAWMTDNEGGVYWIGGDTVWGRVHSNNSIQVSGSPVFMGKLTTAKTILKKNSYTDKPIYKSGYETGVANIYLPKDLSMLTNAAASGGRSYTGDITVTLYPGTSANNDGFVVVTQGYSQKDTIQLNGSGFNGAIVSTGRVNVKGTLDGKLTIGCLNDIYIVDNILYENPSISSTDDVLGLVAESDVIVADNTANSNNVEIHGCIFARDGSFTAEHYNSGSPRGLLKVTGSIVQKTRGAVGTFSGTSTLTSGYSKRYRYDDRLADNTFRPPFYPGFYRQTLKIAGWWENVRPADWWD